MKSIIPSILTVLLPLSPLAAQTNHDHAHEESSENFTIPATLPELGAAIQSGHHTLMEAVAARNGEAVHHTESDMQACLKALPDLIINLPEGSRIRIAGQAKNLSRAYDNVHHAADDESWENAAAEMKKADGGLQLLMALLPKQE